jgi:sugar phosphate isomerase/epimerase
MQLGISTYTYGWAFDGKGNTREPVLNEFALIELAKVLDVSLVQVGDNLPLHTFSCERLKAFKNALQQNNIKMEAGARGLTDEHLKLYSGICKEMDAHTLRFVIDDEAYEPTLAVVKKIVLSCLHLLQENDIVLAIENHDRLKVKELAVMIDVINSPHVGICLDTVNSMGAGEGLETVIDILAPYTVNLHIKDFGIKRLANKQGFIIDGRIAGEGMLDVPCLLRRLNSYHRCNTCVLEQWVAPENDLNETVAKEKRWAEKSIEYLKSIGI